MFPLVKYFARGVSEKMHIRYSYKHAYKNPDVEKNRYYLISSRTYADSDSLSISRPHTLTHTLTHLPQEVVSQADTLTCIC